MVRRSPQSRAQRRDAQAARRRASGARVDAVKMAAGCAVCGRSAPAYTLDFHHLDPAEKTFSLAQIGGRSWQTITAEIAKCVVLCAIHHKMLHQGDVTVADFKKVEPTPLTTTLCEAL